MTWQVGRQRSYIGGESQALLPEMIGRDEVLRLENAIINENGTLSAFMRTDEVLLTGIGTGIGIVRLPGGTYDVYYATGHNIYVNNFSTYYTEPISVNTGLQYGCEGAYIQGIQEAVPFLGKYYVPNPNPLSETNGILNLTDKLLVPIPGKCSAKLRKYTNRLWVVNTDGTIQISDNGDASTWDLLNILWLPNQEPAIDFIPVQGGAIVYSQNSIFAMYGSDYTDISFVLILTDQMLSSGAVLVGNTVYIPSVRGVIRTTLNAAELIPHEQETFFKQHYALLSKQAFSADVVKGCYLQRIKAVLFTWSDEYGGSQSFIHYLDKGAYSKVNQLLPEDCPYIHALNDTYIDALIGSADGVVSKCRQSNILTGRKAYIQTRHEDVDITKDKVWRCLTVDVEKAVPSVAVDVFLNYSADPIRVYDAALAKGENTIWMDIPRSKTISFLFTIANTDFNIRELRLKYREAGSNI